MEPWEEYPDCDEHDQTVFVTQAWTLGTVLELDRVLEEARLHDPEWAEHVEQMCNAAG